MSHPPNQQPKLPYVRQSCLIDGCDRMEELAGGRSTGGLCAGHRNRKKLQNRGLLTVPFDSPLHDGLARRRSPRQGLHEAAIAVVDGAPMDRLCHAAIIYANYVATLAAGERRRGRKAKR